MKTKEPKFSIAILGCGPAGLFMYKRLVESSIESISVSIFEATDELGKGMPYSRQGANPEHVTNVSGNEIPDIVTTVEEWIQTVPQETLEFFNINANYFNDFKVLPRLLFGQYLSAQFDLLKAMADQKGMETIIHLNSKVTDLYDEPDDGRVCIEINNSETFYFDKAVLCTGHSWPSKTEGKIPNYFDSPYPPSKLKLHLNHPVAIRGASLTAIDAIRTLARSNGTFNRDSNKKLHFEAHDRSPEFRLVLHSKQGLLPAIRFHFEDSHLTKDFLLSRKELNRNRAANEGFLSLDYVFEKDFKEPLRERDPKFYETVKDMSIEEFVEAMMAKREKLAPFELFKLEYAEAERSIRKHESVHWKELLAILSFAMNYPAKHFSAEDMQRLKKVLMPLISLVIAFVPQSSCDELLALHAAGRLDLISVTEESEVEPLDEGGIIYHYKDEDGEPVSIRYETFVDAIGQPPLSFENFPFDGLKETRAIIPATLKFRSEELAQEEVKKKNSQVEKLEDGNYHLKVPGIRINDEFQVIGEDGHANPRVYVMAVPFIGGYNPDYSGLDFCEEASRTIISCIEKSHR